MSLQDLRSWFLSLLSFEVRKGNALNEEELYSVEEDIGVDEDLLQSWLRRLLAFGLRASFAPTDQERRLVEDEKAVEDEYNRESQNSVPPAA